MGSACSNTDDARCKTTTQQSKKRSGSVAKQRGAKGARRNTSTEAASFTTPINAAHRVLVDNHELKTSKLAVSVNGKQGGAKRTKDDPLPATANAQHCRRNRDRASSSAAVPPSNPLGPVTRPQLVSTDEAEPSPLFEMPSDKGLSPLRQKAQLPKMAKLCGDDFVSVLTPKNGHNKKNSIATLLESSEFVDHQQLSRDSFGSLCDDKSRISAPLAMELPHLNSLSSQTSVHARIPRKWAAGEKKRKQAAASSARSAASPRNVGT